MTNKCNDKFGNQETARRRDAVIKRMLATPPKPHSEMKVGKRKAKLAKATTKRGKKKR